jgi:hypothetical protein
MFFLQASDFLCFKNPFACRIANMAKKSIEKKDLDKSYPPPPSVRDTVGKKYERLTVLSYAGAYRARPDVPARFYVNTRCSCGKILISNAHQLRHGGARSCGCLSIDIHTERLTKHGFAPLHGKRKSVYNIWKGMRSRCYNPKNSHYKSYGGRGIRVCKRWEKFENFLEDMGEPSLGMSIERVDVNGDYCPENCTWIPLAGQAKNRAYNWTVRLRGKIMTAWEADQSMGRTRKTTAPKLLKMGKQKSEVHDLDALGLAP